MSSIKHPIKWISSDEFEPTSDRIPTYLTTKNLPDISQISISKSDTNGVIPFRCSGETGIQLAWSHLAFNRPPTDHANEITIQLLVSEEIR